MRFAAVVYGLDGDSAVLGAEGEHFEKIGVVGELGRQGDVVNVPLRSKMGSVFGFLEIRRHEYPTYSRFFTSK